MKIFSFLLIFSLFFLARIIWNDILSSGFGHLAAVWLEAIRLERVFGDVAFARKLFYKAINSVNDHPYQVKIFFFVMFFKIFL